MEASDWQGCYDDGWQGEIVPEAFSHPAKFSRGLIRRIYEHMIEEGWLKPGDCVIDPFGGVGLGAIDAMRHGLTWCGVELESRFVDLGNQNIEFWMKRYAPHFPGWGTARLVQGDSRNLATVLQQAGACVSSPPFAQSGVTDHEGQTDTLKNGKFQGGGDSFLYNYSYGTTPGNLGNLRATDAGLKAAVSSPLYSEARIGQESGQEQCGHHDAYSRTPGQLGAMKANGYEAAVSSPPFEQAQTGGGISAAMRGKGSYEVTTKLPRNLYQPEEQGLSKGQLSNSTGDDFWLAARQIVEQVYAVLAPGARAVWVVKAFVKNKKRVDFPGQWQQMCEAVGFVTLHEHRAWLVKEGGTQIDLFGNHHTQVTERKSFFRRLAEQHGSPRIDWEQVLCMVKE